MKRLAILPVTAIAVAAFIFPNLTTTAEESAVTTVPIPVGAAAPPETTVPAPPPVPVDPPTCYNGGEFIRVTFTPDQWLCGHPGPELTPLIPMTIPQMVDVIFADIPWLATEMDTIIIPREAGGHSLNWHDWDPGAVNPHGGAVGLTQLYHHDDLAAELGYTHEQLKLSWPNLVVAHELAERSKPHDSPWRCDRCSMRPRRAPRKHRK